MHDTTVLRLKNSPEAELHPMFDAAERGADVADLIFHVAELNPNGNKTYTWDGVENAEYGSDSTAK